MAINCLGHVGSLRSAFPFGSSPSFVHSIYAEEGTKENRNENDNKINCVLIQLGELTFPVDDF